MKKATAAAKPVATSGRLPDIPEHQTNEASRIASGFDPANWHAAIRLQVAVRDALQRPVSLEQALDYARDVFNQTIEHYGREMLCKRFDETTERARRAKETETRQIAATAGKR